MVERKSVELWPWIHNAENVGHRDLVYHLRTIPKNSIVLFEGSQKLFEGVNKWTELFLDKSVSSADLNAAIDSYSHFKGDARKIKQFRNQFIAMADILQACKERGIKVIPVEPNVGMYTSIKLDELDECSKESAQIDEKREQEMVRLIKSALWQARQASVPCIVGLGHVKALQEKLGVQGIASSINTSFFERTSNLHLFIDATYAARQYALLGKKEEARQLNALVHKSLFNEQTTTTTDLAGMRSSRIERKKRSFVERVKKRLRR